MIFGLRLPIRHLCNMIEVQTFVFNPFQENTYVVYDATGECAIIDPGCADASEESMLAGFIESRKLRPVMLINTHCHIDHVLGNEFVARRYQLPLHLHAGELKTYRETDRWTAIFGMPPLTPPQNLQFVEEGDELQLGQNKLSVLFTPGHSVASISLYNAASSVLFSGDVLFEEGVGRTDLPGGNFEVLAASIRNHLYPLPDPTTVYSGHGKSTTIGHEKRFNPFVPFTAGNTANSYT